MPVTLALCALAIIGYLGFGAASPDAPPDNLADALLAVFRHGNIRHVGLNVALLLIAGPITESRLGSAWTLVMVALSAVLGTIAQFYLVGPAFVGLSGPVYAMIACAVLTTVRPENQIWVAVAIAAVLGAEIYWLSDKIAIYPHLLSTLIGGSFAMLSSLFGSKHPTLKPMQYSHVSQVVAIINETDEDDAAEAENLLLDEGVDGMFVLMHKGRVVGVTGYEPDDQVDDVCWLSWTYLAQEYLGQGYGSQMMNDLLGKLNKQGYRKVFIATSDYKDFGRSIYAGAHRMYEDFGAEVEMTLPDYHNVGEAKIVYGLENPEFQAGEPPMPSEKTGIAISGIAPEPETKGVVGLIWQETPAGVAGLDHYLEKARGQQARIAVIALPSDLSRENAEALETHGFKEAGKLTDYYSLGLHQVWWMCSLANQ
ncbi:rhomboid family intramembrane serine protease [Litoreibacter arenae]|nr:rhomboid family intramembrane serine protease [Litoreibacter arenae]